MERGIRTRGDGGPERRRPGAAVPAVDAATERAGLARSPRHGADRGAIARPVHDVEPMTDTAPVRIAWIEDGLLCAGEHLPAPLRRRVVDVGEDAVPRLVSILIDDDLRDIDGPGEGLARYAATEREAVRLRFASVLGALGVRDEAVFTLLVARLAVDPAGAAMDLAEYGDERALPHLARTFDDLSIEAVGGAFANLARVEIEQAIEELGGELTEPQRAKAQRGAAPRETWRQRHEAATATAATAPLPKRPRRNDPCSCGSGTKYKKCCLAKDEAARRQTRGA